MFKVFKTISHTFLGFILLVSPIYAAHSIHHLDVLAIHSYNQEYPWTSSQYEAFKKQFKNNLPDYNVNFSTEYLDTKRIAPSENYQQNFLHYLNSKYNEHRPELIYVTDDNALNFINSSKSTLGWKVPIIFSGINNTNIYKANADTLVTGIFEYKDIQSSISLAKKITKDTAWFDKL